MTLEDKIEKIKSLKEDELREKLLIPLFSKMGFLDPILHHHSNEKGKDIVIKEYDPKFKKTSYIAVVVKAGDVNGSSSSSSSYFTLLNQVKQAINEPYKHIYELKEISIDQVIIVISGKFLPTSLESIYNTLKAERLDKAIKEPIDINKLPGLIDEYFSEYWDEFKNEYNSLIEQRNKLLNNFSKLSKILFPEFKDQEKFLSTITKTEYEIDLLPFKSITKYVANISYNKINIDEIEDYYTDTSISNSYCDTKKYLFDIKENAKNILYEMDKVVEILKSILEEKNPEKLVDLTMDLKSFVGGVGNRGFQFSSRDIEYQDEFYYVLQEYKTKKELLKQNGLIDFYQGIHSKITIECIKELKSFYEQYSKDEKNIWLGLSVNFDIKKKRLIELKLYKFNEIPKEIEKDEFVKSSSKVTERSKLVDDSMINVELAVNYYGFFRREEEYNAERKAKEIVWYFERGFEKHFFELLGYEIQ